MKRKLKPIKHVEVGPYEFDFYFKSDSAKCTYLEIKCGEVATFRIDGRTHPYGYLFAAAEQGLKDQLHGYAVILNHLANRLTQDQQLVDEVVAAIDGSVMRKMDEGADKAAAVTEAQETADQVLMEEVVKEADMSDTEREANRAAFKEAIRNVIEKNEDGD